MEAATFRAAGIPKLPEYPSCRSIDRIPKRARLVPPADPAVLKLSRRVSTPAENLTVPPVENLTDRRGDEPQAVATS